MSHEVRHTRQITLRGLDPELERAIRRKAKETGKSLNRVVRELVAEGAGLGAGERSRTVNDALAKELLSIRRRKLAGRTRTLRKKGPSVATEEIAAALRVDRGRH